MPVLDPDALQRYVEQVFQSAGAPPQGASIVARHLVSANLMGHDSHGVIRIPWYLNAIREGSLDPSAEPVIEQESPATAVMNGNWNFGQVVARRAMELAVAKAAVSNIACVTAYQSHHVGRLGDYPPIAASAGMIGIAAVNNHGSGQLLAPFGGLQRRLSPNPISIAFPTGGTPFLLDMTTSAVAGGKLDVYRNRGEQLPEGWAVRSDGSPMRDAGDFRSGEGAILPLGGILGYKGFGLAFAIDILCGGLSPAGVSRADAVRFGNGLFTLAIRVEAFTPLEEFRRRVEELAAYCRSAAKAGEGEILIAGEPEARSAERRRAGIPIDEQTWAQITAAAASTGVVTPAALSRQ